MKITDINDLIIKDIQSLRELPDEVLVDSDKLIRKFLEAKRYKPLKLYIKSSLVETTDYTTAFPKVIEIEDQVFENTSGYKFSKGVLATFEKPQFLPLEDLKPPFVILNGVTSPENIGSIVRTITGLGFKSLIIDSKSCSPFLRRCVRVSMGNINFLNVHRCDDLKKFMSESELNFYGAANEERAESLYSLEFDRNSAFIIGSEGHGIDKDILNLCQTVVKIPITEGVLHYNASIACAIIASEFSRQLSLVE